MRANLLVGLVAAILLVGGQSPARGEKVNLDEVLDAFSAAVAKDETSTADQRRIVLALVTELRNSPEDKAVAITESLRVLSSDYKEALASLGEDNLGAAIVTLTKLRESDNPFLAAEASYYLARAHLLDERFEDALPLLSDLQGKWSNKTVLGAEVLFLQGVAEVALLRHQEAMDTLGKFLTLYPEAPERMRVGAFRQLEQLKLFQEGTLSDVHLRMEFSRRKLSLEDTGTETREQQDKIIDILAKLIKEAEERECACRGGGSGSGQKQGQPGESESQAQGEGGQGGSSGGGSKGIDSDTVKRLHRGGPQSPWSQLRDKERDPVYSAIKERFPARYQQLIEQYYKSFQDDTDG
jgi:tetratricopeptide (TPR) repeat protein